MSKDRFAAILAASTLAALAGLGALTYRHTLAVAETPLGGVQAVQFVPETPHQMEMVATYGTNGVGVGGYAPPRPIWDTNRTVIRAGGQYYLVREDWRPAIGQLVRVRKAADGSRQLCAEGWTKCPVIYGQSPTPITR